MDLLPDALDERRLLIIKACSTLRLTEEIRAAAFMARETKREFILAVRQSCKFSSPLSNFVSEASITILRTASE